MKQLKIETRITVSGSFVTPTHESVIDEFDYVPALIVALATHTEFLHLAFRDKPEMGESVAELMRVMKAEWLAGKVSYDTYWRSIGADFPLHEGVTLSYRVQVIEE